jgi:hypothetical protein
MGCLLTANKRAHYLRRNGKGQVTKNFTSPCELLKNFAGSSKKWIWQIKHRLCCAKSSEITLFLGIVTPSKFSGSVVTGILSSAGLESEWIKLNPHRKNVNKLFSIRFKHYWKILLTGVRSAWLMRQCMYVWDMFDIFITIFFHINVHSLKIEHLKKGCATFY